MKRDMDLVRRLLLRTEGMEGPYLRTLTVAKELDLDEITVARHVELLVEAGYLEAELQGSAARGTVKALIRRLTWRGYEFLDDARNETVWNKAKTVVAKKSGSVSLEVVREVLVATAKGMIFGEAGGA